MSVLLSDASFQTETKFAKIVFRPGSSRTHWESLQRLPRASSWIKDEVEETERKEGQKSRGRGGKKKVGMGMANSSKYGINPDYRHWEVPLHYSMRDVILADAACSLQHH